MGKKGYQLEDSPEVWVLEGYYLAQAVANYVLILTPKKVIMGGGVMKTGSVISVNPSQSPRSSERICGVSQKMDDLIVPPGLGDNAGLAGSLALATKKSQ